MATPLDIGFKADLILTLVPILYLGTTNEGTEEKRTEARSLVHWNSHPGHVLHLRRGSLQYYTGCKLSVVSSTQHSFLYDFS